MLQINQDYNNTIHLSQKSVQYEKEQQLVKCLRSGGDKAYRYLYSNYSNQLFMVILNIVPDYSLASDVLQDVFTNIYKNIDSYDEERGAFFTWMRNIARHAAIDMFRSKGYRNYKESVQMSPVIIDSFVTYPPVDSIGLKKVLYKIKPKYRELIELNYLKGYSKNEIAQMLGMPLGTVKTRIKDALIQLRELV